MLVLRGTMQLLSCVGGLERAAFAAAQHHSSFSRISVGAGTRCLRVRSTPFALCEPRTGWGSQARENPVKKTLAPNWCKRRHRVALGANLEPNGDNQEAHLLEGDRRILLVLSFQPSYLI